MKLAIALATIFVLFPIGARIFEERASTAGIDVVIRSGGPEKLFLMEGLTGGVCLFDYNQDGFADIFLVNGSNLERYRQDSPGFPNRLYQNKRDGNFQDVTVEAGLGTASGWGMGCCSGDFDGDGLPDLYVTRMGPNNLYRNNGDGTFSDVALALGLDYSGCSTGCAWADFDGNGWLDLYVANYVRFDIEKLPEPGSGPFCRYLGLPVACGPQGLEPEADIFYRNKGNGSFVSATTEAGFQMPGHYGFGVLALDYDNDGDLDLFVANDSMPNFLFQNDGRGIFREVALEAGVAFNEDGRAQACMGVDAADFDNDGFIDLVMTNFARDTNVLYRNEGDGTFLDVSLELGMGDSFLAMGWGVGFLDYDLDGWQDLLVANGHLYPQAITNRTELGYAQELFLYRNLSGQRFKNVSSLAGARKGVSRGIALADFDNNGAIDVVISNLDDQPFLLIQSTEPKKNWLVVRLQGNKPNRFGVGARVTVRTDSLTQIGEVRAGGSYLSSSDPRLHFGLGNAARVEEVKVQWPRGQTTILRDLSANQIVTAVEPAVEQSDDPGVE